MTACAAVRTAFRRQIQNLEKLRQRRLHSTQTDGVKPTESAQQQGPITPPAKVLPPPLWTRLGPLTRAAQAYGRAHHKRPKTTQILTSLFIFLCGDISAQTISGDDHDLGRTARALFIGGTSSLPSYFWIVYLSNRFNFASRALSIAARVVVNQIVFAPLFNIYFFGMQALLSGASIAEIWERLVKTVPRSILNSAKLWPAVMTINFAFVPLPFRSMFSGTVAVGWQTYLSWLNKKAEESIAAEAAAAAALVVEKAVVSQVEEGTAPAMAKVAA